MAGIFVYRRRRWPGFRWLMYAVLAAALIWVFGEASIQRWWTGYQQRLHPPPPPIQISIGPGLAGNGRFYRFEAVPIRVRVRDRFNRPIREPQPLVQVYRDDALVRDAAHRPKVHIRYNRAAENWEGIWPIPLAPHPGEYRVQVRMSVPTVLLFDFPGGRMTEGENAAPAPAQTALDVFSQPFEIVARTPAKPAPQIYACDLEGAESVAHTRFAGLDGRWGDWRTIFDWVEFMGCDTLLYQGPTTDAFDGPINPSYPWNPAQLSMIRSLGREAHRRGLRFGVWIVAFRTHGPPEYLAPYIIPTYDPANRRGTISLLDPRRPHDIARVLRQLDETPEIDFIGFDYLRDALPSYDGVERFVEELRPQAPDNWEEMNSRQREEWLKDTLTHWQRNRETWELWNWWRAHRVAEIVHQIVQEARPTKPLFAFTLGWRHGIEHGQDPCMLLDAGLSLDGVMLYQVKSAEDFQWMIHDSQYGWASYRQEAGELDLLFGNQIDFYWHQKSLDPPAPLEFRRRIREALTVGGEPGPPAGIFIHDLTRLLLSQSSRGPYSSLEWAVAAGAAVSDARLRRGQLPASLRLEVPEKAAPGVSVPVTLIIGSQSREPLSMASIAFPPTPGLQRAEITQPLTDEVLAPGQEARVEARATFSVPPPGRADYAMLGARLTWKGGRPHEAAMDFDYVRISGK